MRPEFNHCYTPDPGHRFHSRLGKLGFNADPKTVEHPGDHSCRFIMLTSRDRLLRPHFKHRNYEWKARGTKERLPGWTFLSFKRRSPFAEVGFTEYEDYPERAKLRKAANPTLWRPTPAPAILPAWAPPCRHLPAPWP